jgi:maleylacetate reductase
MIKQTIAWPAVERMVLGAPAADAVSGEAERLNARRVFLLVSRQLDTTTDEIERVRRALGARYAASYHGIRPHVPKSDVVEAAKRALESEADLVVTIGGGSVTDAGKILLLCLEHRVTSVEQLDAFRTEYRTDGSTVPSSYRAPSLRIVCVPTTLSGGELNSLAGATDEVLRRKQGFQHRALVPSSIVLDPSLSLRTPDWLWVSTGIRAVDHCVETLASEHSNAFCDGVADAGLRLLAEHLPRVRADPNDLDARLNCQIGSLLSMLPLVAGVPMGASHAIGHLLGAVCSVPHGYTSCVMAPYVQAWNAEVGAPRQRRISACLGDPSTPTAALLHALIAGLDMPRTLGAVGVREEHLKDIAAGTLGDIWGQTNSRPLRSSADVMTLLERAMVGQVFPSTTHSATQANNHFEGASR